MSEPLQIVRPRLAFESEFMMVRNAWVQDKRIAGLPSTVFLYIMSQAQGFELTYERIQDDLGISLFKLRSALRTLEDAGYLRRVQRRDDRGRQLPTEYHLLDPEGEQTPAQSAVRAEVETTENAVERDESGAGGQKLTPEKNLEFPGFSAGGQKLTPAAKAGVSFPSTENLPLKEDQLKNINHHHHDDEIAAAVAAPIEAAARPDDDSSNDLDLDAALRRVHPRLSAASLHRELARRLPEAVSAERIDLVQAASEVIERLGGKPVSSPVAYVATAIARTPYVWQRRKTVQAVPASLGREMIVLSAEEAAARAAAERERELASCAPMPESLRRSLGPAAKRRIEARRVG